VKGGGVGGRQTLKVETVRHLQQCGVMYDRRNLNIGDFLWIARERVGEIQGQFRQLLTNLPAVIMKMLMEPTKATIILMLMKIMN